MMNLLPETERMPRCTNGMGDRSLSGKAEETKI